MKTNKLVLLLAAVCMMGSSYDAQAQDKAAAPASTGKKYDPGVTDTEIKIGSTAPLSVFGGIFVKYNKMLNATYQYFNDKGGVNGRKITLITLDDAFNTSYTVSQTRKLIEEEQVFMMAHQIGAAQALSVRSYLNKKKIPSWMISSGSPLFNNPGQYPYSFQGQNDNAVEMGMYVDFILKNYPDAKIAYMGSTDESGQPFLRALKAKLKAAGKEKMLVAEQKAYPTDATISAQMLALKESGANVLVSILGVPQQIQSIQEARSSRWKLDLHIINIASSSREATFDFTGLEAAKGIVTTTFAKDPADPRWDNDPAMIEYKDFMRKYMPGEKINDIFFIAFWSWANTTIQVLQKCGDNLTRENFLKQAQNIKFDLPLTLPGSSTQITPNDYNWYKKIFLAQFDGKLYQQIDANKPAPIKLQ